MKMVMEKDSNVFIPIGPIWKSKKLSMNIFKKEDGEKVMKIQSHSLITRKSGISALVGNDLSGHHYCKLLSPARVMEWIYTDGLREHFGYRE